MIFLLSWKRLVYTAEFNIWVCRRRTIERKPIFAHWTRDCFVNINIFLCVSLAYLTIFYVIDYGVHSFSFKSEEGTGTWKPKSNGPVTAKREKELKENHTHAHFVKPLPLFSSAWISNDYLLHREKKDKRRDYELGFFFILLLSSTSNYTGNH
jgi:hypothetical protein